MCCFNYLISRSHSFLLKWWSLSACSDFTCFSCIPTDSSLGFLTFVLMIFLFCPLLQTWFMFFPLFQGISTLLITPVTLDGKSMSYLNIAIVNAWMAQLTAASFTNKFFCRSQRVQPIIVDAGIYLAGRNQFFQATEKRDTPDGFKFFTGISLNFCTLFFTELDEMVF